MTPEIRKAGDGRYEISGDLVFETARDADGMARKLLDYSHDAEIDLTHIGQVNSAGIALLLDWCARFRKQQKKLRFRNIPAHLARLIRVNGLETVFDG